MTPITNEFGVCAECFAEAAAHNEGDGGLGIYGTDPYLRVRFCEHNDRAGGRIRFDGDELVRIDRVDGVWVWVRI